MPSGQKIFDFSNDRFRILWSRQVGSESSVVDVDHNQAQQTPTAGYEPDFGERGLNVRSFIIKQL